MGLQQVPTLSQSIELIRSRVRSSNKNLNTLPGSVLGDVFVTPQAISDTQQKALTYYNSVLTSLQDLLALESDTNTLALLAAAFNTSVAAVLVDISNSIDRYASNIGETRKQPTKATLPVLFGRVDPPTQDLTVPIGVQVKGSNGQTYVTTGSDIMFAGAASTYYDPDLLLFVISVAAEATLAGSAGNAGVGTITDIITSVSGFTQTTNIETASNGRDLETDTDFVARLLAKWQAIGAVTKAGITASILDNVEVFDVYEAAPRDPFNLRGFGRTDVYIEDRVDEQITETFSAFNHPTIPGAVRPSSLPVTSLSSVNSGVAELQADVSSSLRGSVQSLDAIRFTTNPTFPVTVIYTRNKLVADAQNVFNDNSLAPATQQDPVDTLSATETAILIHEAPQLLIDYTVTITVAPGQVKGQVITAAKTNLLAAAALFKLGQTVFIDDFNKIVEGTLGVLRLAGNPTKFSPSNQAGALDFITPDANEAIVINNLNIF